jgi:ATP:ADP antiporter, AAA family
MRMSSFSGLVDVRPEERRTTFAAFGTLLAITTGHTLMETARDALFLTKLPAAQLPWMYLIIAAFALLLAQLSKAGAKADSKGAIGVALVLAAGVTAGFWALVHGKPSPWILYALYIWSGLFASWVTVQFWTLLGRIHTMTQAKRLYGFIGGGAVAGGVLGALLARATVAMFSPRWALLVAAGLFVVAAGPAMLVRIPESDPEAAPLPIADDPDAKKRGSMSAGMSLLWNNPFARRVLGIVLVSTITVTLADFLFKSEVAKAMPDARQLAAYLSTFYAVTNALALVAQVFIAPWVFRTYGVQRALFFFPVLVVMAASGVLATGGLVLAAVVGLKLLDGTFRYSIHRTSTELLLVPVPDAVRERIKPIVDLVGSRGGQAVASIAILVLVAVGGNVAMTVGAFVLALGVLWVALVVTIRTLYLDVFRDTLKAGGLTGKAELPELDLGALETLFAGLNSSLDLDVLASLELLADQKRERLIPALILYHPSRDVVLRALEIFTHRGRTDFVSIADRLNGHPDREVAAAALRARTAVAPDKDLLRTRLEDRCPQVSATALIALIARGWIDDEEADRRIEAALATRSWVTAAELARSIRDISTDESAKKVCECLDELLVRLAREAHLFADGARCDDEELAEPKPNIPGGMRTMGMVVTPPDVRVRLEVARAMAVRKKPEFLPVLLSMLANHELRAAARAAIRELPDALAVLEEAMASPDLPRDVRVHLPRTITMFEPESASRVLLPRLLVENDGAVRFKVLRSLVRLRRIAPSLRLDDGVLLRAAEANLDHAAELRRWGAALGGVSDEPPSSLVSADPLRAAHHLLADLVRDKETHATQRLFYVLELLYGEDFDDIGRGLRSRDPKRRASSLELVENLVKAPLKARVLALVGDVAPAKAHANAHADPSLAYDQAVLEILAKGGATMRTLAEYRAVELGIDTSAVTGRRSAAPGPLDEQAVAKRLFDKARDLFAPDASGSPGRGATRAPA